MCVDTSHLGTIVNHFSISDILRIVQALCLSIPKDFGAYLLTTAKSENWGNEAEGLMFVMQMPDINRTAYLMCKRRPENL